MKMRKIIAVLSAVLMLCTLLPLGALVSAAETVVFNWDFEDGNTQLNGGSVVAEGPDGSKCFKWTATGGWSSIYKSVSGVEKNTDYVITFKAKASVAGTMGITIQNGGWGSYYSEQFQTTTAWKEYTIETNVGDHPTSSGGILFKFQDQGKAMDLWVDNLKMVKKESAAPETPEGGDTGESGDASIENLVANGDFEAGLTNWTGKSGTKEIVTNDVHGGTQALKLTAPGQWGEAAVSKAINVTPNKSYVIKWWSKHVSGSDVFNMYIIGDYTAVSGQNWMSASTGWVEHTWTIKPSVSAIQLKFSTEKTSNTSSILIDDVMMYEKPMLENGGFETGTTAGWTVYYGGKASAEAAHSGSYGLDAYAQSWNGSAYQDIAVTNGKTYELSFWYKIIQDGFTYKVLGQTSGTQYVSQWYTNVGVWTQVKFQFLATDESLIRLNFCGAAQNHNGHFYLDDVQIKELKDPSNDGYIKNGDFETGTNVGWTVHQSTTVNKASAKDGDYGMEVHGNGGWGGALQQKFNLQANRDYILRFDAKAVSQGFNIKITDDLAVAAGTANAKLWGIYFSKTEWTNYEIIFNSGENTTAELAFVGSGIGTADDIVYLDNVSIEKVGGEDPIPNNNITGGQNSISEDVNGLAFRFDIAGIGAEILETNEYVKGSADIKLYKDRDDLYKLVKAGAIVTNNLTVGKGDMNLASVDGKKTINIDAKYLC